MMRRVVGVDRDRQPETDPATAVLIPTMYPPRRRLPLRIPGIQSGVGLDDVLDDAAGGAVPGSAATARGRCHRP